MYIVKKIKDYLMLDIENGEQDISSYSKNLFEWIEKWEKDSVIKNIKVHNINNRPNQFLISTPYADYFQSYDSVIAMRTEKKIYLDVNYWDYSTTTGKYRNIFLNENKSLTLKKINANIYSLVDLNN